MDAPKKIGLTTSGELMVVEMDKSLGREILTRPLTIDEIRKVVNLYNAVAEAGAHGDHVRISFKDPTQAVTEGYQPYVVPVPEN